MGRCLYRLPSSPSEQHVTSSGYTARRTVGTLSRKHFRNHNKRHEAGTTAFKPPKTARAIHRIGNSKIKIKMSSQAQHLAVVAGDDLEDDHVAAQGQGQANGLQECPLLLKINWELPHLQLRRWLLLLAMPPAVRPDICAANVHRSLFIQ